MSNKDGETLTTHPGDIPWGTDGLSAPTYFVEHIRGALVSRGFIKLNMIENKIDASEDSLKAVHVVTIVTPVDQARAWAKYLSEIADMNGVPTEEEMLAAAKVEEKDGK